MACAAMVRVVLLLICSTLCIPGSLAGNSTLQGIQGTISCGDHGGQQCHNDFVHVVCGSKDGACCHDDFNGWCCPRHYKCKDTFHNPGTHCMTDTQVSSSCLCEQTDFEIVAMEPVGEAKVEQAWNSDLTACCQYPTEDCGWRSSITMTNSQTVSWSDSTEVGLSMEWGVELPAALALTKIGFEVKNTFTTGQSTTTSSSQTYSSGCTCSAADCKGPFTSLDYKLKEVKSTQPVKIKAKKCGTTHTMDGTVSTTQFMADYQCLIKPVKRCPKEHARADATVVV